MRAGTATKARPGWQIANGVMLVALTFSVIVQLNDPDPLVWVAIYGAAALVCAFEIARRARWWFAALVGTVALVWAATIASRVIGTVPFAAMFEEFEMKNIGVEESREMYGLLIVAVWMAAVAVRSGQRAKRTEHHGGVA
jgi:hypothetical protein